MGAMGSTHCSVFRQVRSRRGGGVRVQLYNKAWHTDLGGGGMWSLSFKNRAGGVDHRPRASFVQTPRWPAGRVRQTVNDDIIGVERGGARVGAERTDERGGRGRG